MKSVKKVSKMKNSDYRQARLNKDKSFDGQFFFAVKTTGIFCRPSCPSPVAKEKNVAYFESLFDALDAGYRPCLRCRPDIEIPYDKQNIDGVLIVEKALKLIYEGFLNTHSIKDLSDALYISERQLRHLFVENLGHPPVKIAKYHKVLFAKKLLLYSTLSLNDIIEASGFGSSRQFNQVFKDILGITPSEMRKKGEASLKTIHHPVLLLPYKEPFNFEQMIAFMRLRQLKGIESIKEDVYARTFRTLNSQGYFTVKNNKVLKALELEISSDGIHAYMDIYNRVRRMFDLNTDFEMINKFFEKDPLLKQGMINGHVPRLPVAFNTFEFVIRAILGQQVSVKAATTFAGRIVEAGGILAPEHFPEGLTHFFPTVEEFKELSLEEVGLTKTRQQTVWNVVEALSNEVFNLTPNQSLDQFHKDFSSVKGIGDWTVHYVAMRGLGMVDSFPAMDLGVLLAMQEGEEKPKKKEVLKRAEAWQPYRAYAALCLWQSLANKEGGD